MQLYHVLNRGVDGRSLFTDDHDRLRFVHDLYEFNDAAPILNVRYRLKNKGLVNPYMPARERQLLVDIHGWVLMKNHYHLLLSERVENGISSFLRKLNTGYANYFNERNKRQGALFQGRTKKILIAHDAHLLYILHYIHLNPLDYLEDARQWRLRSKGKIASATRALEHLTSYRWSSYPDYAGQKNFPSLLTTSFFKEALGDMNSALREYLALSEQESAEEAQLTLE